jgi:nitrogen-specific signal transduction histidine kinase/CheY-like chemotaxis protein
LVVLIFVVKRGEGIIQKRAMERLRLKERLSKAERLSALGEMAAGISHEIRNPLGIIRSSAELLKKKVTKFDPSNTIPDIIVEEANRLNNIITGFINFASPRSPVLSPCRIEEVIEKNITFLSMQIEENGYAINRNYQNSLPEIQADSQRLRQVLINLLSNAVKFTPDGGEAGIELDLLPDENAVRLTVWDTGIGVPADKHELLFEPFVQLDGDLARQHAGTGLGLALVSRLTEMHGGRIELESATGRGSRFKVILPVGKPADITTHRQSAAAVNQPYAKTDTNETTATDEKATVLIIEDNPANINHVRDYLIARGFRVETAVSGLDGINKAWELLPDVVLMDIQMPGINGYEAVERLREDERTKDLHIIALTALAMPEDRLRCLNAGANDYLSKPYGLKALEAMINKTCCAGGAQEQ